MPTTAEQISRQAWHLYVDLTTDVIPAIERGEIRPGELHDELTLLLAAAQLDTPGWGPPGRQVLADLVNAADLLHAGRRHHALDLLHWAEAQLYLLAHPEPG